LLEQNAPAPSDGAAFVGRRVADIFAENADRARPPRQQADDGAQQDRLAAARCADQAADLAR